MDAYVDSIHDTGTVHENLVSAVMGMAETCPLVEYLVSALVKIRDFLLHGSVMYDVPLSYHENQAIEYVGLDLEDRIVTKDTIFTYSDEITDTFKEALYDTKIAPIHCCKLLITIYVDYKLDIKTMEYVNINTIDVYEIEDNDGYKASEVFGDNLLMLYHYQQFNSMFKKLLLGKKPEDEKFIREFSEYHEQENRKLCLSWVYGDRKHGDRKHGEWMAQKREQKHEVREKRKGATSVHSESPT